MAQAVQPEVDPVAALARWWEPKESITLPCIQNILLLLLLPLTIP